MMVRTKLFRVLIGLLAVAALAACNKNKRPTSRDPGKASTATGLAFGRTVEGEKEGGFEVKPFKLQPAGPNLVFIEGGRHILGSFEQDVVTTRDNLERTVTIASFYMDETEIANIHWLEYLHFLKKDSSQEIYEAARPDTTVWASRLAFNDPYVDYYLRHPGFRYFPVVGVNWKQANDYCTWRTEMVNRNLAATSKDKKYREMAEGGKEIPIESGVVLPGYMLPTEAQWEYAAMGMIGTQYLDEMQDYARIYPWDGHSLRNPYGRDMGKFLANFKRGRGDYAGIAGKLNDGAMITEWIYAYPPNDFGLYNMAGNVNEWVNDLYRPLSFDDMDDLNPYRRDDFIDGDKLSITYDKLTNWETLIDNNVRVYKGGSWKDVSYWLSPGTRRYMEEDSCTATVGFRCAMIEVATNK